MKKLFLDDERSPWDDSWDVVRSFREFIVYIEENGCPDVISFDHDLHPEHYQHNKYSDEIEYNNHYHMLKHKTGFDCAKWLCEYCVDNSINIPKVNVHSASTFGARKIANVLSNFSLFYYEEEIDDPIRGYHQGFNEQF